MRKRKEIKKKKNIAHMSPPMKQISSRIMTQTKLGVSSIQMGLRKTNPMSFSLGSYNTSSFIGKESCHLTSFVAVRI